MSMECKQPRKDDRDGDLPAVRTRKPDRQQMVLLPCSLEELLPPEHPARIVWAAVTKLDLSRFHESIKAREGVAGREPADPAVLVGLWLLAAVEGVGSGRQLAELCEQHAAFRWMCGGVSMNYHTLNDFRTGHQEALDGLFTQVLGRLMHANLVDVKRITQDGTKVRASAGWGSFHKRSTLEKKLAEAREHIKALGRLADESSAAAGERQRANAQRVASDRLRRVERAMEELAKVEQAKEKQKKKPSRENPAKASTTDPEARIQKMPDGGFRPAYNIQLAQDPSSRAVVGVAIAPGSSDKQQDLLMREQVQGRTGQKVLEQVMDGNYLSLDGIDRADSEGVTLYVPAPEARKQGQDRYAQRQDDSAAVAQWRQRMKTPEAKEIYRQRASTCETVNADLKINRGLSRLLVRGTGKVLCVALWLALSYNLMRFGTALLA
jgi:transposase